MKKYILLFCTAALLFSFSACDDGNVYKDGYKVYSKSSEISSANSNTTTDTDNLLVVNFTKTYDGVEYQLEWTCHFEDGKLVKSVITMTAPDGTVETQDTTEQFAGYSKSDMKSIVEAFEKEEDAYLTLSTNELSFSAGQNKGPVTVSTNQSFTVQIYGEDKVEVDWISVSPSSYTGSTRLTIYVNENAGAARTANVIIHVNDKLSATLVVKQEASESFLCPDDKHPHAIDLGTGVLWACCNVGASLPEEYGNYYAWGETSTKSSIYDWSTYKWCNGSPNSMTKYCTSSSYGTVDNKTQLELSDDAARVNWGGSWRMPTIDELNNLSSNFTWTWTTVNNVNGYKVTASNGNSIFLPAAGCRDEESLYYAGSYGFYWSSSLYASGASYARSLGFYSGDHYSYTYYRCDGQSVRPVMEQATTR